ncbi:MAG: type I pullulanase [Bacilli bacterium]|jgi:pullulanase
MQQTTKKLLGFSFLCSLIFFASGTYSNRPIAVQALEAIDPPVGYTEDHVVIYYYRTDGNYDNWNLWLWPNGGDGNNHDGNYVGATVIESKTWVWQDHPVSEFDETGFNYIIRQGNWVKQTMDLRVEYADLIYDEINKKYDMFLVDMDTNVYLDALSATNPRINAAAFINSEEIAVEANYQINSFALYGSVNPDVALLSGALTSTKNTSTAMWNATIELPDEFTIDYNQSYQVELGFEGEVLKAKKTVALAGLFDDPGFIANMTYDGNDLGLTYTQGSSTFKVWAPTSSEVKLRIYHSGTPVFVHATKGDDTHQEYAMVKGEKGVWSFKVDGDLAGKYYTYVITNNAYNEVETCDPYAKAAGINGLRGMILDLKTTDPEGWDDVELETISPTELVIYELHIADLTSDVTWNGQEKNRHKYLGLIEEGTTYTEGEITVKTGFDHIKELGVNAVQILPFFDQDNDEVNPSFNWGYNPQNYNVLEGVYSANPYDGATRITEMKKVIQAYAKEGIRIIMDVVYNHVSSVAKNPLNITVPEYYFRYTPTGNFSNNSGCGNDTASERKMFHKFMVDSTDFLASEYKLGGYRFDLMGLHDIGVMNELAANLKAKDPDFIVYGEPWQMITLENTYGEGFTAADHTNLSLTPEVGGFNDKMRDGVKGGVFQTTSKGWVQSGTPDVTMLSGVINGLRGRNPGSTNDPKQVINYVACHDNHTLFDKMLLSSAVDGIDENHPTLAMRSVQAEAFTLLGQGVAFVHAGSEIMRSKPNDDPVDAIHNPYIGNSYKSSYEVNDLEWNRKITYLDEFKMYQTMIDLKVNNPAFQLASSADIEAQVTVTKGEELDLKNTTIVYEINAGDVQYKVVFHGASARVNLDLTGYAVILDTSKTLEVGTKLDGKVRINTNSVLVLTTGEVVIPGGKRPSSLAPGGIVAMVSGGLVLIGGGVLGYFFLKKRRSH